MKYGLNKTTTYTFTKNGVVSINSCTRSCLNEIGMGIVETSESLWYPPNEGWVSVQNIHKFSIWLYVRVVDGKLEGMWLCGLNCGNAQKTQPDGVGIRAEVMGENKNNN